MFYVYVLRLSNGDLYKGYTADLRDRITRHIQGREKTTCQFLPVELIFYSAFKDKETAIAFEKYLKSGSGRAFLSKRLIQKNKKDV